MFLSLARLLQIVACTSDNKFNIADKQALLDDDPDVILEEMSSEEVIDTPEEEPQLEQQKQIISPVDAKTFYIPKGTLLDIEGVLQVENSKVNMTKGTVFYTSSEMDTSSAFFTTEDAVFEFKFEYPDFIFLDRTLTPNPPNVVPKSENHRLITPTGEYFYFGRSNYHFGDFDDKHYEQIESDLHTAIVAEKTTLRVIDEENEISYQQITTPFISQNPIHTYEKNVFFKTVKFPKTVLKNLMLAYLMMDNIIETSEDASLLGFIPMHNLEGFPNLEQNSEDAVFFTLSEYMSTFDGQEYLKMIEEKQKNV